MKIFAPIAALFAVVVITAIVLAGNGSQPEAQAPTATPMTAVTTAPELPAEPLHSTAPHESDTPILADTPPEPPFTTADVELLAKTVWGEARGCSPDEQRLVVWTVLQRVDAADWSDTIQGVVTQRRQFAGYDESHPIDADIYALCREELVKWWGGEKAPTHELYAPTTPYYFFDGDGSHNWFRENYKRNGR